MLNDKESIQLINTAIIKSKERKISSSYEERLSKVCQSPEVKAISDAICNLSETQNISRDAAAIKIIDAVRELDNVWGDYVMLEGIGKLKDMLKDSPLN